MIGGRCSGCSVLDAVDVTDVINSKELKLKLILCRNGRSSLARRFSQDPRARAPNAICHAKYPFAFPFIYADDVAPEKSTSLIIDSR